MKFLFYASTLKSIVLIKIKFNKWLGSYVGPIVGPILRSMHIKFASIAPLVRQTVHVMIGRVKW